MNIDDFDFCEEWYKFKAHFQYKKILYFESDEVAFTFNDANGNHRDTYKVYGEVIKVWVSMGLLLKFSDSEFGDFEYKINLTDEEVHQYYREEDARLSGNRNEH